jgi:hypothetical protein
MPRPRSSRGDPRIAPHLRACTRGATTFPCKSPISELSCRAGKPQDDSAGIATPVLGGFIAHWLAVGPLTAEDPAKAIYQPFIANEGQAGPDAQPARRWPASSSC